MTSRTATIRLCLLAVLLLSALGFYYLRPASNILQIRNAYVSGRIIDLTATRTGKIEAVLFARGDRIQTGQLLFRYDDTQDLLDVERRESQLISAIRQSLGRCLSMAQADKNQQWQHLQSNFSSTKLKRYQSLEVNKSLSQDLLDEIAIKAQLDLLAEEMSSLVLLHQQYLVNQNSIDDASVLAAMADLKYALYQLSLAEVRAPYDAYVYALPAFPGMSTDPDKSLTLIVPDESLMVEANILETKLRHIAAGQAVTLYSDLYDTEAAFSGRIHSIVPAAASAFSVIPRNNVDSNWIKVNQRVPVLIKVSERLRKNLPIGTSVRVVVALTDSAEITTAANPTSTPTLSPSTTDGWEQEYQTMVSTIIDQENARLQQIPQRSGCTVAERSIVHQG